MPTTAWYPQMPPALDGEDDSAYTNRLLGIGAPSPYDHRRNRQCSIGYHEECSEPTSSGGSCECPCHRDKTVEMLAHAVGQVSAEGDTFALRFGSGTWDATIVIGGRLTEVEDARTPTDAMTALFRALGWMD